MARHENPPFPRGGLGSAYSDPGTVDTTGLAHLEGTEWEFEDKDFNSAVDGVVPDRTNQKVICRVVRNKSGGALLPKKFVMFKTDGSGAGDYGGQVSGYGTIGKAGGVVDEALPAAGVPSNELFYVVIEGPTQVVSDTTGDTTISVGSKIIPGTTGDGTVIDQDVSVAAGSATFAQVNGAIGRAMQACTTTATAFLVNMQRMGA